MRCYYVVTDNNAVKKDATARAELKERMAVSDLEDAAPNRRIQFGKVDSTGSNWFGGIDLPAKALARLNQRDTSRREAYLLLQDELAKEIRAALPTGERSNITVQVVVFDADPLKAAEKAQAWLAANWSYPDVKDDRGGDIRPGRT